MTHDDNSADGVSLRLQRFVAWTPDGRLAARIRECRRTLALTQDEVASSLHDAGWCGANRQLVSDVERQRKRLSATEARLFAAALGVDPDWLTHGLGMPIELVTIKGVRAEARANACSGHLTPTQPSASSG
jgi:transcriptional regulator with XRE-family HTH domain